MQVDKALAQRDVAARPVLEQIRADRVQTDYPVRGFLERLEAELFSPELKTSAIVRKLKIKGTSGLERFVALTGLPPAKYVEEARLETAARLLIDSEVSIEAIAGLVGFAGGDGFGRAFSRWSGMPPSEVRTNSREAKARGAVLPDPAFARRRWLRKVQDWTLEPAEAEAVLAAEARARGGEVAQAYETERRVGEEAAFAITWWARSRELPAAELERSVRGGCSFATPAVFEYLRQQSREEGRSDRRRGLEVATLAMASLGSLSAEVPALEHVWLEARAWLALGDAHRLAFDLTAAEDALADAAVLLTDPAAPSELRAELAWMRSGLRRYQRRLPEALAFAEEAVELCQTQNSSRVMALLMRGHVRSSLGEFQRAAGDFRDAAEELEPGAEPYLRFTAMQNLAHVLSECGCDEEAERYLAEAKWLAELQGEPEPFWHAQWIEGLLAARGGREAEAERCLQAARVGFESLQDGGHLAIVLLDLAILHLRQLKSEEALADLGRTLPHLEALRLDGEGLVALKLLQQAVAGGRVTIDLLRQVRTSARQVPSAQLSEASAARRTVPV